MSKCKNKDCEKQAEKDSEYCKSCNARKNYRFKKMILVVFGFFGAMAFIANAFIKRKDGGKEI